MLYTFHGDEPEQFPTVQMRTPGGDPHGAEVQPGEVVDVVAVDGVEDAPVIHARLVPADKPAKKHKPAPTEEQA